MLNILYFASLRESVGLSHETLPMPASGTVAGLIDSLRAREGKWVDALAPGRRWRVAVNQEMAGLDTPIKPGDEIAIFPPVTGG
jgi:sulfur-carrier protein